VVLGLEGLLAAYRIGSPSRADAALTKLEKARMALAATPAEQPEAGEQLPDPRMKPMCSGGITGKGGEV